MTSKLASTLLRILLGMPRFVARRAVSLLVLAVFLLADVPSAAGHARLLATEPAQGTVTSSPERVTLTFDEPVETALGSLRVYDGDGGRVDRVGITRPGP